MFARRRGLLGGEDAAVVGECVTEEEEVVV
jgi:hypothetical protein